MLSKILVVNCAFTVHSHLIIDTNEELFYKIGEIRSIIKEKGLTAIQLDDSNARYIKINDNNIDIIDSQINVTRDKIFWSGLIKDTTFNWETIKVTQNELFSSLNLALTERE
jgi:hypothetical protein